MQQISAADIAALERILDWAQGAMLQDPEQKAAEPAEVPAEEPTEAAPEQEPAVEVEVSSAPAHEPSASALSSFRIGSGPKKPEPMPAKKHPVGKRGRY